jgi:hypothetical protein
MAQNENVVFKLILDTSSYDKTLDNLGAESTKADKSFKELNNTIAQGAKGMQDVATAKKSYNDLTEASIQQTKLLTAELQNALVKDKEFMAVGKQVAEAYKKGKIDEVQATKLLEDAINKGVDATRKMQVETEKTGTKIKSYRAQIAELKAILPTLQGDEFVKAQAKLANLTDAMGDQQAQIKLLASDTRALDTAMQGLQLGVGIFAGLQGASALFGSENENVQKALLKVNGAMAVLQSLQTIQNVLEEKSAFMNSVKLYWKSLFVKETVAETVALEVNTVATETNMVVQEESTLATKAASIWQGIYTFAVEASSGALRLFKIALASTGIGLAIIGLGLLIANFDKVKKAIEDNTEGFQTFKKVLLFISPPIALIIKAFESLMRNIDVIKNTLVGFGDAVNQTFGNIGDAITKVTNLDFKGFYNDVKNIGAGVSDAYTKGYMEQEQKNKKLRAGERLSFLNTLYDQETKLLESQGKDVSARESASLSRQLQAKLVVLSDQEKLELRKTREGIANKNKLTDEQLKLLETGTIKYKDILDIELQMQINHNQNVLEAEKKLASAKVDIKASITRPKNTGTINGLTILGQDNIDEKPIVISKPIVIDSTVEFTDKTGEAMHKNIEELKDLMRTSFNEIGNQDLTNIFGGFTDAVATYFDETLSIKDKARGILKGIQSISDGLTNIAEQQIDKNIARYDKEISAQKNAIDKAKELAEKGNSQLLVAEEKKLAKLEELRRAEGKKKKAFAIADATVNIAVGATEAYSQGGIIGPILAALVVALGAVQIGIISSQQFAKGGFTGEGKGQRDNTGHIPVGIVHDNEFVFDKETTSKNREAFEYIHKNKINIADLMTMPNLTMNPILSNYHVTELGELKKEMKEVRDAIKDLPRQMPQAEMHVGIRGLSITTKNINEREQRWKR